MSDHCEFFLRHCPLSVYVTEYHWRTVCFCNKVVRITHSAAGLGALGRILTFMVGVIRGCLRGVCRGRRKLVHTGMWQEGVREEKKAQKGGGGVPVKSRQR